MVQNDAKKLAEAKQMVYLKGFTDGVLVVGEYAGKKVRGSAVVIEWDTTFHSRRHLCRLIMGK